MCTALAASIGTGNIAGVSAAIVTGGPGAVFWMWFAAFFGMMTKFAENVLGIYFRRKNKDGEWSGGPMYFLKDGLGKMYGMKSVANVLANASTNNGATIVTKGAEYKATITANSGYEISSIKVTMGGTDITSSAYSNGVISIAKVTGNIVITASAVKIVNYTNQIPISTDANGNIYNGTGYKAGVYLSSGAESSRSGSFATGFIPCGPYPNYTVRMKNVTFDSDASDKNYHRISIYDANRQHLVTITAAATSAAYGTVVDGNGVWTQFQFRPTTSNVDVKNMAYFRLCCSYIGEDSVITVNEEITE